MKSARRPLTFASIAALVLASFAWTFQLSYAETGPTVTIDSTTRYQTIDGFGTCLAGSEAQQAWWQNLYYDDLGASILRVDLTPNFAAPYSDFSYNSPWFHNNPALPGPDNNNVRTYTGPTNYSRTWSGRNAPIAVMKADANQNQSVFDFNTGSPQTGIAAAKAGQSRKTKLGDFKLVASIWSPAPWVKVSSGNTISGQSGILPKNGTPWPFIWAGNFAGGKLDVSNTPLAVFNDGTQDTSALTQFARSTASYILGYQRAAGVQFYAISIQNELNFETFYNSMTYPLSSQYITALKAVRAEFDKYPELKPIKIMGPEDLLGGDPYGMWQYGGGENVTHKNLQYLKNIEADGQASAAVAFYNIHGYAPDGVSSSGSTPKLWDYWANGWTESPAAGIPANVQGFKAFKKKSWMTETSGEDTAWLSPASGFPGNGGWSVALKMHQALTTGEQSAWVYWQLTDGNEQGVKGETLTDKNLLANSPKYVAFKHFARYIRPNAQRVKTTVAGSTTLQASAYVHDANKTVTAVLVNSANTPQTVTVKLPATPSGITSVQTAISGDQSLWKAGTATVQNGSVTVTVPAYGVATLYGTGGAVVQPTAGGTTTPTTPACPTAAPPAPTPQNNRPRAYLPIASNNGSPCQ